VEEKVWQGKTHGGNLGQRFLFFYFRYGSIAVAYAIVSFVILFYLVINYKATRTIYSYFRYRHNFGVCKSALSTYRNHYLFGKALIDKFAMFAGRRNEYSVTIVDEKYFDQIVNNPEKGAIILNSHVGCAEIAGYLLSQKKKRLNAVVFGGEAATMMEYRSKILEEQNIKMVPVVDGFSHIFDVHNALRNNELAGMAGDRVYPGSRNIVVEFLGAPAPFPIAAFQLAVKVKVPVLALFVMQDGYKKFRVIVRKIEVEKLDEYKQPEQIELLVKKYVMELEGILKEFPLQWYNFYQFWN
jgi:predicted LPLAT superfamily acyltransferase